MHIYSACVRPGGGAPLITEFPKNELTAAEIILLRHIHGGDDAVVKIQYQKSDRRAHAGERDRLKALYGDDHFEKVFGTGYEIRLPNTLPDVTAPTEEEAEAEIERQEKEAASERKKKKKEDDAKRNMRANPPKVAEPPAPLADDTASSDQSATDEDES